MRYGGLWSGLFFLALAAALSLLPPQAAGAQEAGAALSGEDSDGTLPRVFRGLALGMSLEDLKAALLTDSLFNFRGNRDVSFLPARDQSLVETTGSSFIKRAFFQLRDGSLFIMAFSLNTAVMDHYTLFTQLSEKYGPPGFLDPSAAVWENEDTRIALERPLTVKYIDKRVFDDIIAESGLGESEQVRRREEFINEF
jgi:hypothetical protein